MCVCVCKHDATPRPECGDIDSLARLRRGTSPTRAERELWPITNNQTADREMWSRLILSTRRPPCDRYSLLVGAEAGGGALMSAARGISGEFYARARAREFP